MTQDDVLNDIPPAYRERFIEIVTLTDGFCDRYLNDEYKDVCRTMAVDVCQEELPVLRGKAAGWACGLMYAAGRVNFLTDPSQSPHMKAEEIAAGLGVSTATMHVKHKILHDGLDLMPLDPDYTTASRLDANPLVWMLEVNGFLVDIRAAPRDVQAVAYENGLIPYIPADREEEG